MFKSLIHDLVLAVQTRTGITRSFIIWEAVVGLMEDEPRRQRLGAAARRIAEERYGWDSIARRLAAVYDEVAGGAGVHAPS